MVEQDEGTAEVNRKFTKSFAFHCFFCKFASMKQVIDFLRQLSENNNKAWFDSHKQDYLQAKQAFDAFALDFLHGVEQFDPRVKGLTLRDITYRIYRDLRFTQDKRPYKWHMGAYVCPKGKKSGMAGYYIHLEPATRTYFICAGLYNPTKQVIASVRDEIMCSPEEFHASLMECSDFTLPWDSALRNVPRGYSETDSHSEYYRLRSYEIYKHITEKDVLRRDFLDKSLADLERTHSYNEILNKCCDFIGEE